MFDFNAVVKFFLQIIHKNKNEMHKFKKKNHKNKYEIHKNSTLGKKKPGKTPCKFSPRISDNL